MSDYIHSGSNKMNKVEAYKNDNKLLLADKLGHAKVSSLKEQNLINTINTVATHDTDITQLKADMNKVRGAYVYKGTVETEYDLPLNNNSIGDVYNVSSTGMNYAWNGENWDELGSNFSSSSSSSILSTSELYQQVYSLRVTGSAAQQQMMITDEDLGGQYKDILIFCFTPQAPIRTIAGDAPDYLMHLSLFNTRTYSISSISDRILDFPYYNIDQNDYLSPFFFIYHFLNDGGLIRGKYGKTKLANTQTLPILNDTLTEVFPFPEAVNLDDTIAPKGIFITPSLPINSILIIYARNKINSNEETEEVN